MDNTTQEVEDFLRTHNIPFKALNHLPITTCEEGLKIPSFIVVFGPNPSLIWV